ncbi:transporter [Plasmodium gonderi]|uniref:Transporter n=1 Tax=Plasmodium gonderi TaxID=77519 RepID=A0A1Y1JQ32_PLAGO|nr:transporter [Plasmodium gonderi]GAW82952.1 transporter [Plasmodium gonderi]
MGKLETCINNDEKKWKKKDTLILNIFHNAKNLFPKNNLQYTYINTFLLCLYFTFLHKYLDQTLPSLYKSIENDFNINVKTLYYMNTIYKLAYSGFNFFFALFFDYTFKKIILEKYEKVDKRVRSANCNRDNKRDNIDNKNCDKRNQRNNQNRNSSGNDTHYKILFKGESEHQEKGSKQMDQNCTRESMEKSEVSNSRTNNSYAKTVEDEKTWNNKIEEENSTYTNDEVIWGEYRYTLKILVVSSIIYVVVIFGIMASNNFINFFFFMFIMGINNSCIYILIQKIYTNKVFSDNRSTIFGFLHFFSSISHMLSISINTNLSNKIYFGINGWRICYFVISFFPIIVSIFLLKLIKHSKFKENGNKKSNLSYLVSFDNVTETSNESDKENYCKRESYKLTKFSISGRGKKKKKEEEILFFNSENNNYSQNESYNEPNEKADHLPFEMKKSCDRNNILNRELGNASKMRDKNSYLSNTGISGLGKETSINDDFNISCIISNDDRINSNLVKRSFKHSTSKKTNSEQGEDANLSTTMSNSEMSKENYDNHENCVNGVNNHKDLLNNSLNDRTYQSWGEVRNSTSIFSKRKDEKEKQEEQDELVNLLEGDEKEKEKKLKYEFSYLYEIKYVFKNYSFWLMITMGMLNGIPKHVLSLMIYFFQYCNISDFKSGLIMSLSWLCASLISPFIGIISDYIYKLNKDINRQLIGMCTHCLRIILMFIMFFFIPKEAESFIYFVIISLFMGVLSGWINIGTHKPIIIDIVKQKHTAFVMALMSAFENIGSSIIGTFFLSFLLNRYNYIDKRKMSNIDLNINKHNVKVLSDVLLILTCLPWLISLCLLYVLKFTYKKDKLYNNMF